MKSIRTLRDSTSGLDDYLASKSPGEGWEEFRSYQGGKAYRKLAETLETLQHGLCGYCEIDLIDRDRQIEHVIPRSDPNRGKAKSLDVTNMIACCTGGTQKNIFGPDARGDEERYLPSSKSSCGEAKGNASDPAFVDPRTLPALPSLTKVQPNGMIEVDEDACEATRVSASDMKKTINSLGLNVERLCWLRERRWEDLSDVWGQDYDNPEAMDLAARSELLPDKTGRLSRFFTTSRTYFSGYGEKVLAEEPQGVDLKDNTFFAPSPRGSRHRLAPKLAETGTLRYILVEGNYMKKLTLPSECPYMDSLRVKRIKTEDAMLRYLLATSLFCFLAFGAFAPRSVQAQATVSVSGVVTDASSASPLQDANVVLLLDGVVITGAASGADGSYEISGIPPGDYMLAVRFVGYEEEQMQVSLQPGESLTADVALRPTGFDLNAVVVSASRSSEKVLDAPASISVLDAREIESVALPSSAMLLRNVTGVDMAQTGVNRYEIVLRGFNNVFSGATYVMTDYRRAAVTSLGLNYYSLMPISQIDLERVEVVRGPGSALFGAGVDAGVIHFISKDPFTHPGTTVRVGGGLRNALTASLRHAGVAGGKLGYKVVADFQRANDFAFDPADSTDAVQLATFREEALPVDYNNHSYTVSGLLSWRPRPNVTLTANGGYSTAKSIVLSGIGTTQAEGFGYTYGQLRLDAGGFFAQAYANFNDAGDSFVYREESVANVVDNSTLVNVQGQYDFDILEDRFRFIVGAEYELTNPVTKHTIFGRNEDRDRFAETGAYVQSVVRLSPALNATVAVRADRHDLFDGVQISPRAALVFKPDPAHSLRATFNRAFASPGTNSLFLDINAGAAGPLTIQARGTLDGFHFQRDAQGGLIASSMIPDIFGAPVPVGVPLDLLYSQIYGTLSSIPVSVLQGMLAEQGLNLPAPIITQFIGLLSPDGGITVTGLTPASIGYLDLNTLRVDPNSITQDVVDVAPLEHTVSEIFEVGYKGLLGERLLVAVDGYYTRRRNFVSPLRLETPFVLVPEHGLLFGDLEAALAAGIADNATLNAALQAVGLSPGAVSELIVGLARPGVATFLPENSPIGIVQPVENMTPGQLLMTYRSMGKIEYYGLDVSAELLLGDRLRVFGNLSRVSDNFFDASELGEEEETLELSMNSAKTKVKGGFTYESSGNWSIHASVRYTGGFEVRSGLYSGSVPKHTLLDVGAGYDLGNYVSGLRMNLSMFNVLDQQHREFIGSPEIGRMGLVQMTLDI